MRVKAVDFSWRYGISRASHAEHGAGNNSLLLDKIGLKEAVLADAHITPAMEMRCSLSGESIIGVPLQSEDFSKRFQHPHAVTQRADIHASLLRACQGNNLVTPETHRTVDGHEEHQEGVTILLANGDYPLRRGELYNLVAVFHSDHYVEGWNTEGPPHAGAVVRRHRPGFTAALDRA